MYANLYVSKDGSLSWLGGKYPSKARCKTNRDRTARCVGIVSFKV